MVACGRLLRPNSTPLPSSMPYFFIVPPFAHITSQGLCSYCSQKTMVSSCWDHKAMWLPLQEMSRIMRTGGKEYKSIKWCILMLTVVWTKVVDVSAPKRTRKQSGRWVSKKHGCSTAKESALVGSCVTYNCTPMGVFSLEVGWSMCGETEMPLMCLSYFFGFCFILWLSSPFILFW